MSESLALHDRPRSVEAARKIIDDIRFERGLLDEADEVEIRRTSVEWQEKYRRNAERHRTVYARFTKTYVWERTLEFKYLLMKRRKPALLVQI